MTFENFRDLALVLAFLLGGYGMFRNSRIKGLKDSNEFLTERDEIRQKELEELKEQYTRLEAEYVALKRVVTNEAYMTALAERLANQWSDVSSTIMKALNEHNTIARDHWTDEKSSLEAILRALENR